MAKSSNHPEVLVVGAGIAGASTAFHLADRGTTVTLIERTTPASGPTGRSGALPAAGEGGRATLRLNPPIARLLPNGSRVVGVETAGGERLEAGVVVLATGPWTRPILEQIGVSLPLTMERHSITALDVPGRAREILPFTWCDDPLVHYARPDGENRVLVGTSAGRSQEHTSE